jgi:hypothetical protein
MDRVVRVTPFCFGEPNAGETVKTLHRVPPKAVTKIEPYSAGRAGYGNARWRSRVLAFALCKQGA